ncbi:MAG: hypothetical protein HPY57_14410 [Ignavibacteria bacterium]|nr:hypothetical protein [Ignavibacteria bacterium]
MKNNKHIIDTFNEFNKKNLNEQLLIKNDKPPMMGTQYNQIKVLYKLTNDDFSYVPSSVKYWNINTDNTLINKIIRYYGKNDEEKYQSAIKNLDFFFIYYNGKRYIYLPQYKRLYDKHGNIIKLTEQSDVFNQQMNEIIHNTLNPPKSIEIF